MPAFFNPDGTPKTDPFLIDDGENDDEFDDVQCRHRQSIPMGSYHIVWDEDDVDLAKGATMLGSFDSDGVMLSSGVLINDGKESDLRIHVKSTDRHRGR